MKTLARSLFVLMVMLVVAAALLPLAQTGWADSIRAAALQPGPGEGEPRLDAGNAALAPVQFVAGLLKPTLFLLVPGWITYRIMTLIKKRSASRKIAAD